MSELGGRVGDLQGTPSGVLILASASPQRRAILTQLGVAFRVVVSGAEEIEQGDAATIAAENARRKALAVAERHAGETVLGVDTVVALDGAIHGKPGDREAARATLRVLSGRTHAVLSGLCVVSGGGVREGVARTEVTFRSLSGTLLDWYLEAEEWRDRAGGYAIQGRGAAFVTAISGDYFNVVGLPVAVLLDLAPDLLG